MSITEGGPQKNVWKGEDLEKKKISNLEVDWTNLWSVTFETSQLDFFIARGVGCQQLSLFRICAKLRQKFQNVDKTQQRNASVSTERCYATKKKSIREEGRGWMF